MKKGIHPELKDTNVTCSCGESFLLKTVTDTMRVEVCSKCHPYYTGSNRNTGRGGMVERFKNRYNVKQ